MKLPSSHKYLASLFVAASVLISGGFAHGQTLLPVAAGDSDISLALGGHSNLALSSGGATAFASSSLGGPGGGYGPTLVNDGIIANAWIANTSSDGEYVGVAFPSSVTLGAIVFRSDYYARSYGTWSLQYTTDASPGGGSTWTQIGTFRWESYNYLPRLYFEFAAISNVTGIRLVLSGVSGGQNCVQSLEAYGPAPVPAGVPAAITPSVVGDSSVATTVTGRTNWALSSGGAIAFASSSIGGFGPELANDGNFYGTPFIVNTRDVNEYLGVAFPTNITLSAVAWKGWFGNRSVGSYRLEYTTNAAPNTGTPTWKAVGQYFYAGPAESTIMPRSYFELATPLTNVTGIRLVFPFTFADGTDIQEIEAYSPIAGGPDITTQPVGGTADVGENFTFTVVGTLATSYQWQKDGTNIAGATGASLAFINVQVTNSGSYTVVLSNTAGSVTSSPPAVLTVTQAATIQPTAINNANIDPLTSGRTNLALASLGSTTFASSGGGAYGPEQVNNGIYNDTGNAWIAGTANNGEYVGVAFADVGGVALGALVFGGETGYDFRSSCTWSLQYTTDASPGISTPASAWHIIGDYTNWVSSLPMPRSYFSFAAISNVTGIRLVSLGNLNLAQKCIQELQAYSPMPLPVGITTQPAGGTAAVGDNFTFTVAGTNMTGYQWQKDGTNIPGATASSLTLVNVQSNDAAAYTVVLLNLESSGSITSTPPAVLTVTNAPVYASYQAAILAENPIHYYPLDEASGSTALDSGSLNFGGGTYTGGCTLGQPGPATNGGTSVYFDGASGTYVDLGLFHPGDEMTVECWANLDADAPGGFNSLVARFDGSYELDFQGTNVNWLAYNAAESLAAATASAPRGNWHHLVGVYQTNGVQTIYKDGVATTSARAAGVLKSVAGFVIPDRVLIGATRDGANSSFNFKGYIADVAFYDHAVVPGHLLAHYNYNAVAADTNPPVLASVACTNGLAIYAVFDETVRNASATNMINYIINAGAASATNAVLQPDFKTVLLTLSSSISGSFTVAAGNVLDVAGNASRAVNVVNGTVVQTTATTSTNISYSVSGGALTLTWPESHLGWFAQSNSVDLADTNYWFDIPGSETATNQVITLDPALTNVFYRLRMP